MDLNIMYVTEEEKQRVLKARMEAERKAKRKANQKRLSVYERTHKISGTCMLILAILALVVFGIEGIGYSILCGLFSVIGFAAKEEDREAWLEE